MNIANSLGILMGRLKQADEAKTAPAELMVSPSPNYRGPTENWLANQLLKGSPLLGIPSRPIYPPDDRPPGKEWLESIYWPFSSSAGNSGSKDLALSNYPGTNTKAKNDLMSLAREIERAKNPPNVGAKAKNDLDPFSWEFDPPQDISSPNVGEKAKNDLMSMAKEIEKAKKDHHQPKSISPEGISPELLQQMLYAGGGGLAGAALGNIGHRLFGDEKNKGRRSLATLAGGGLGAGLGYYLGKQAAEEKKDENSEAVEPPRAKDLLTVDSLRARLADYLSPGFWGGERAGRAQTMAAASGFGDVPFGVRHPSSQVALRGLRGSALGGLAGGLAGFGLGGLSGMLPNQQVSPMELGGMGALAGAGIGASVGALVDPFLGLKSNRRYYRGLNRHYNEKREAGELVSEAPKFNELATYLAPFRGPHRVGQMDAHKAISGGADLRDLRGYRDALTAASLAGNLGGLGSLAHLPQMYGQNIKARLQSNRERLGEEGYVDE